MMTGLAIIILLLLCGIIYLLFTRTSKSVEQPDSSNYEHLTVEKARLEERLENSISVFRKKEDELKNERKRADDFARELEMWKSDYKNLESRLRDQASEIENLQQKFTDQFKSIANDILKQNSKEFTDHNQKNMQDILNPLKERIQLFEKKVEDTYEKETRDKISLREEVKKLYELNSRISEEANNLSKALKSDVKKQGNWGEMVLERILERSGLIKDSEYKKQVSLENESGQRIQPDFIIYLPDEKHIIIDSKVSLVAYERYSNSNDDNERELAKKEHLVSIKNHINGLSDKFYQQAKTIHSPDFVLLFIPIESSFSMAVQFDQDLFNYAWDRKIVIVSPSTLFASLKTIASIWKQERQNKNAQEIAERAGQLYDKFVGFVEDLKEIGKNMDRSRESFDSAMKKLSTGSGNLVGRAEKLIELGAKNKKNIPEDVIGERVID